MDACHLDVPCLAHLSKNSHNFCIARLVAQKSQNYNIINYLDHFLFVGKQSTMFKAC